MSELPAGVKKGSMLSPFNDVCSCGARTIAHATVIYPTGFKVEIPMCKECADLAEKIFLKKVYDKRKRNSK